jgi:hypothetical protein
MSTDHRGNGLPDPFVNTPAHKPYYDKQSTFFEDRAAKEQKTDKAMSRKKELAAKKSEKETYKYKQARQLANWGKEESEYDDQGNVLGPMSLRGIKGNAY